MATRATSAAVINRKIDAMIKKNPSGTRVKVVARNPARVNKFAPSHRVETSLDKREWVNYGDYYGKAKAHEIAKLLHESHGDLYIRVVTLP